MDDRDRTLAFIAAGYRAVRLSRLEKIPPDKPWRVIDTADAASRALAAGDNLGMLVTAETLLIQDIDKPELYQRMAAVLGPLPPAWAMSWRRGPHHYLAGSPAYVGLFPSTTWWEGEKVGELKGAGQGLQQVVLPPSRVRDRNDAGEMVVGQYRWLIASPSTTPLPELPAAWEDYLVSSDNRSLDAPAARPARPRDPDTHYPPLDLVGLVTARGLYRREGRLPGSHSIRCPWEHEHTDHPRPGPDDLRDTSTMIWAAPRPLGFRCLHGHCEHRSLVDLLDWLEVPAELRRPLPSEVEFVGAETGVEMEGSPPRLRDAIEPEGDPPVAQTAAVASPSPPTTTPGGPRRHAKAALWAAAVPAPDYLVADDDEGDFLDPARRFLARGVITEWFSPRGLGKTNVMLHLVVALAGTGLRVLLIDRDNPRREIRRRLKAMGAASTPTLKIIDRTQAPPLTDKAAWAAFPITDYDIVIIDSLDASAEGVGEKDSSKPSLAIASILDVARATDGPAIVVLGNTIKSGEHSRGSGVIEDRADIAYEIRDVTGFTPSGRRPWVEELPSANRADWPGRSGRRTKRDRYRLAFIATKFRVGSEPEPFVLEVRHDTEPWTVLDVTADMLADSQASQETARKARQTRQEQGLAAFATELATRAMIQREAESFLHDQGLTRPEARQLLRAPDARWTRKGTKRRGQDTILYEASEGGEKPAPTAQVIAFPDPLQMPLAEDPTRAERMESGRHESGLPEPSPDAGSLASSLVPTGQISNPAGVDAEAAEPRRGAPQNRDEGTTSNSGAGDDDGPPA